MVPHGPSRVRLARSQDGAAILEFVLVLPILLALLAGAFEIGRVILVRQVMLEAVRNGARVLARVPDPACTPVCSPDAARAAAATADQILAGSGLPRSALTVSPQQNAGAGTVTMRAVLSVDTDLLGLVGLARVLTLTTSHQERRIVE